MSREQLHNESLLISEMRAGSEAAFAALYRYYGPLLYINVLRMVKDPVHAEEIVQELFTRIWQKRESKGVEENFKGYMYKTAQNLVHDFFRKLKRDDLLLKKFKAMAEENYEPVEDLVQMHQTSAILNKAIEQLSPQQKKVYELVRNEGLTYKKAAEVMGISPLTIKEYLVAANKIIRDYITRHTDMKLVFILLFYMKTFS